jgi:hypothetical protein
MRLAELTTRALLGGLALPHLETVVDTSPNPAGLLVRQSGSCQVGNVACGDGCMPIGGVCCAS